MTLLGRWFKDGDFVSAMFAGAGFETEVSNTTSVSASFAFTEQGFSIAPKLAVSVDGGEYTRVTLAESVTLASGLSTGKHTIKVVYDGQNQYDTLWGSTKTVTLKTVTVGTGGTVSPVNNNKKNVLFVGDSITTGSYSLGTSGNEVDNSSAVSAYPRFVAERLGINDFRVGFGGIGVISTRNQGVAIQDIVRYDAPGIYGDDDKIHSIVIVIGTNDDPGQVTAQQFRLAYLTLINNLRILYPTQTIYLVDVPTANGLWNTTLTQIANESSNCKVILTPGWNSQITTTDGFHPSKAGALKMAELLSDALIAKGWSGGTTTPTNPTNPTTPTEPTNLWTLAKDFNPLPNGWTQMVLPASMADKTYRLSFTASSATGQELRVYNENSSELKQDMVLTATPTLYSFDLSITFKGDDVSNKMSFTNLTTNGTENASNIVITGIKLIQI